MLREENEIEPRSSSLVFLGRQNKCFISEYRKSGDSSFFFCDGDYFLIGLPGSSYVYTHRAARRKISDVLRVSSTIYALLSGVNNNQPFSLLQEEENVLNPITDIPSAPLFSLSSPLELRPTLSSITSGRFVSVTSAPRYRPPISLLASRAIFC